MLVSERKNYGKYNFKREGEFKRNFKKAENCQCIEHSDSKIGRSAYGSMIQICLILILHWNFQI